jgi:hypothetical protein
MKPTTTANVSVDGLVQGCDGPDKERSDGFERDGWSMRLRRHDPRRELPIGSKVTVAVAMRQ